VTYYNARTADSLHSVYEDLPTKLRHEGIDPPGSSTALRQLTDEALGMEKKLDWAPTRCQCSGAGADAPDDQPSGSD
jgi:hypothetical protein